jgi:mRNA interferase MazF
MKVARGDVILVDFPFTSGAAQKLRPAVVVQSDTYNRRFATTILASITGNTKHANERTQVAVDPSTSVGAPTGLLKTSSIKCENLATVETRLVRGKIGILHKAMIDELEIALKAALSLP